MAQPQAQEKATVSTPLGDIVAVTRPDMDYPSIELFIEGHDEPVALVEYDKLKKAFRTHVYVPSEEEPVSSVTYKTGTSGN